MSYGFPPNEPMNGRAQNASDHQSSAFQRYYYDQSRHREDLLKSEWQRFTTIFVDTRLWKTKHPRKRFQNFRQSRVSSTDRIEIHQSQPLVWPSDHLYVMLAGCDWWISIRSVDNTQDWRKLWKRFRGCFGFQSRVSRDENGGNTRKDIHENMRKGYQPICFDVFIHLHMKMQKSKCKLYFEKVPVLTSFVMNFDILQGNFT